MELSTVRGLRNLGNSCFMNSALQCLTHIKPLARALLSESSNGQQDQLIYNLFRDHIRAYYGKGNEPLSSNGLFKNLKRINYRMVPGSQHDAHEFALGILGSVEEHFVKANQAKVFEQIFGGKVVSQITCLSCKHISNSYESMASLSLVDYCNHQDINHARSVDDALREFFKPEFLKNANKYRCEKCKTKVEAKKQYRIEKKPNCVVLHLKRFNYQSRKISSTINFAETLSLNEYCDNPAASDQAYELTGIVVHLGGSLYSGHYVSYIKSSGKWYSVKTSYSVQ